MRSWPEREKEEEPPKSLKNEGEANRAISRVPPLSAVFPGTGKIL